MANWSQIGDQRNLKIAMSEVRDDLKERPLHDLMEGLFREHKHDIFLYTRGHLNHDHLWKPPERASHKPWESAGKETPLLLEPSRVPSPRQSLGVEKRGLEAIYNFSVGTTGSLPAPHPTRQSRRPDSAKFCSPGHSPTRGGLQEPFTPRTTTDQDYIADNMYVEELRLPELMLPCNSQSSPRHKKGSPRRSSPEWRRNKFIPSHLGGITKKDQYKQFVEFQDKVLRKGDTMEKGVLTGRKAVEHLEKDLFEELIKLEPVQLRTGGPSFHRLQIYSKVWQDLIEETPTFGNLLSQVKAIYDQYLGAILDTQPHKHSELLGRQVQSLTSSGLVLPGELSVGQKQVKKLEDIARDLLQENSRLRGAVCDQRITLENTPVVPENKEEENQIVRKKDEVVKSLGEQVLELHEEIFSRIRKIEELKQELKRDFVPISVCQHLEQNVRDTEADVLKLLSTNEYLEKTIQQAEAEMDRIFEKRDISESDIRHIWKNINTLSSIHSNQDD